MFADAAYGGGKLAGVIGRLGRWTVQSVRRSDTATGFEVLPRRRVVERALAWLNRNRRLAKDLKTALASAEAWLYLASVQLLVTRLARG